MAALVAHHLEKMGMETFLEPLESYQGCLAAYRPHMIVFNHLVASHLARYSKRLNEMGVKTAILLNEGLFYDEQVRRFNAGRHHPDAHVDHFFCWNERFREITSELRKDWASGVQVVGPARFDFYFEPWSKIFNESKWPKKGRPRILICTNFAHARFKSLPSIQAEKFFAAWKDRIEILSDYENLVEINFRARERFLCFLDAIVESDKFEVVLRSHPREDAKPYLDWYESLPTARKQTVLFDSDTNIVPQILSCDLHVACENCNTSMESWISRKPTLELVFERHPCYFDPKVASLNPCCDNPEKVVAVIEELLVSETPPELKGGRAKHLAEWCNAPDGSASKSVAETISNSLTSSSEPDFSGLTFGDYRRSAKLVILGKLGLAYHYNPFLSLLVKMRRDYNNIKWNAYAKAITPADVRKARRLIKAHCVS